MTASALRSQLAHYCSDLTNLTTSDLIDCKWNIRKLVFSSLVSNCPLFSSRCEDIEKLIVDREKKVRSVSSEDRTIRVEIERTFRNNFMQVVLECLTEINWPPALEAFANPLPSLCSEIPVIINAIEFFLKVGVIPHSSKRTFYAKSPIRESSEFSEGSFSSQQRPSSTSSSKSKGGRPLSSGPKVDQYTPPRIIAQDLPEKSSSPQSARSLSGKAQAASVENSTESLRTSRLCTCGTSCEINQAFEVNKHHDLIRNSSTHSSIRFSKPRTHHFQGSLS